MSYRDKLSVEGGRLSLPSVEALTREELRDWVWDRLHGQDVVVPGDARQGQLPYSLFATLYPQLSRYARQDFDGIILGFVRDMAREPSWPWAGDAADDLLLLVQNIGHEQEDVRRYLVEMAESQRFFASSSPQAPPDVHYRLLQSLVALRWRGKSAFWHSQVTLDADRYAGIAFNGLALIDLEQAFCFLTEVPWAQVLADQVYAALLEILEKHDPETIKSLIQKCLPKMRPMAQDEIRTFLKEEGVDLPARPRSTWDVDAMKSVLRNNGFSDFPSQSARLVEDALRIAV